MHKLDPFQIEGVDFMLKHQHALNADDTGLGKTVQAIECMNRLKADKVLIICLASVKHYWKAMLLEWLTIPYHSIQIVNTGVDWIDPNTDIVIINYDLMIKPKIQNQLLKMKFDVGVCDEAHYLQSLDAKRTKAVLGVKGIIRNCKYKFMLSATPMDKPKHLFPMLKTLANDLIRPFNTFESFAFRYCDGYVDAYSQEIVADGATNQAELKEKLKSFMIRRTESKDRPPIQFNVIPLEPNKAIRELVNIEQDLEKKSVEQMMSFGNEGAGFESQGSMAAHRKAVAMAKLPECIQYIKDLLLSNEKLVVFAYHRDVMFALQEALSKYGVTMVIGGMNAEKKHQEVQEFINDQKIRIFLGQVMAAGESIDGLQKVCNYGVFVESSWVAKDIKQPIGRLRRMGQRADRVFFDFLAVEGTIEYQVLGSVFKKQKTIDFLIGM